MLQINVRAMKETQKLAANDSMAYVEVLRTIPLDAASSRPIDGSLTGNTILDYGCGISDIADSQDSGYRSTLDSVLDTS